MIANRFRAVGWVASVAAAALSCYLVSLQVAAERGQLMKLERRILAARQDIAQLKTEAGTRARYVQLERWNRDVLGLQAPKVSQYAAGAVQLAAYLPPRAGVAAPVIVASAPASVSVPVAGVVAAAYRAPSPVAAQPAARQVASLAPAAQQPMIHHATYAPVRTQPQVQRVALPGPAPSPAPSLASSRTSSPPRPATLLADNLMRDIGRAAAAEARVTKPR